MDIIQAMDMADFNDYNYNVTVKCKTCGCEISFYPHHVMFLQPCPCGKSNYGNPDKWALKDYGDFRFKGDEILRLNMWGRNAT
jgi:hypothetical protein